jgi:hypothetical protein
MKSNFRGYAVNLIPDAGQWKVSILWQGVPCFHGIGKERFANQTEAFDRACELIEEVFRAEF